MHRVFFSKSLKPIQMIIVVWNKSFVAVQVKLAVWIDHLLAEESCYQLLNSFDAIFLHDLFYQPFCLQFEIK